MPKWFESRWGFKNAWQLLGVKEIYINKYLSVFYFLKGFFYSIILFFFILLPIIVNQWGEFLGSISTNVLLNAILLTIGIGFAEELIFRGWLLEEFKYQFGLRKALIFQH